MKKNGWILILVLALLLPACALVENSNNGGQIIPTGPLEVINTPTPAATAAPVPTFTPAPVPGADTIYGWIKMGGKGLTAVASVNNAVYMEEDFTGKYVGKALETPYQVIYDYDCRKGNTYATLNSYFSLNTLKQYPIVEYKLALSSETHQYVVIAMFHSENALQSANYFAFDRNLEKAENAEAFFAEVAQKSVYVLPEGMECVAGDNVLVLAGEDLARPGMKQVMVCRELRAEETVESVTELMQQVTTK